jgi:hypothetical protein
MQNEDAIKFAIFTANSSIVEIASELQTCIYLCGFLLSAVKIQIKLNYY